jgi:hypothetical protein
VAVVVVAVLMEDQQVLQAVQQVATVVMELVEPVAVSKEIMPMVQQVQPAPVQAVVVQAAAPL